MPRAILCRSGRSDRQPAVAGAAVLPWAHDRRPIVGGAPVQDTRRNGTERTARCVAPPKAAERVTATLPLIAFGLFSLSVRHAISEAKLR